MRHIFRPLAQHGSKYNIVYYLHISCTVHITESFPYLLLINVFLYLTATSLSHSVKVSRQRTNVT
jgi:hypothetical protein